MSQHPPPGVIDPLLLLPAQDRLALASELLDSVEGTEDSEWDAAWLTELDRRADAAEKDPNTLEDWAMVRARILSELPSK